MIERYQGGSDLVFLYLSGPKSVLAAPPHVNPCTKNPRAEVLCAFENYAKTMQYMVLTMNFWLGHTVIKYALPEDSASIRHTYLSRPGTVDATIFIGYKAWQPT